MKIISAYFLWMILFISVCSHQIDNSISVKTTENNSILNIDITMPDMNSKIQQKIADKTVRRLDCIDNKTSLYIFDYFKNINNNNIKFEIELCDTNNINTCKKQPIPTSLSLDCQIRFHNMMFDFNKYYTEPFTIKYKGYPSPNKENP